MMLRYKFFVVLIVIQVNFNLGISEKQTSSGNCNFNGNFIDGKCECNVGYFGKECECFVGNGSQEETQHQCIAPTDHSLVCSGRGECICGHCKCYSRRINSAEKYTGKWCQCDDCSCPYHNSQMCGGPANGKCECGKCMCHPGFTDENCGCSTRNDRCIAADGSICNGRGRCTCNRCICYDDEGYGPMLCAHDPMVCRKEKACVQCIAFGTGEFIDDCEKCRNRGNVRIEIKDTLQDDANICEFKDEDDCIFYFSYGIDSRQNIKISVLKTKDCPTPYTDKPQNHNDCTSCSISWLLTLYLYVSYFLVN